jgi:hypothetical protein
VTRAGSEGGEEEVKSRGGVLGRRLLMGSRVAVMGIWKLGRQVTRGSQGLLMGRKRVARAVRKV